MSTGRSSFSPLSLLPGLVATAAVVLMNFVSREDVIADGLDDAATVRESGMGRSSACVLLRETVHLC